MRLIFKRHKRFEAYLRTVGKYQEVSENGELVVYEGVIPISIARQDIDMTAREFVKFWRDLKVENGRKKRDGDLGIVVAKKLHPLSIRMTIEDYELVKRGAAAYDMKQTDYIRRTLLQEASIGGPVSYWGTYSRPAGKKPKQISVRFSREELKMLRQTARASNMD